MSEHRQTVVSSFDAAHSSVNQYCYAFVSCVGLSLLAYCIAVADGISDAWAIGSIAGLAIIQCIVQLTVFLHVGRELRPRLKLFVFGLMLTIVIIFVGGSLWIMQNLNYRMVHNPGQMKDYIESQDGF